MGRRRTIGETRSAGAGRRCSHPRKVIEYAGKDRRAIRFRCRRCGLELDRQDVAPTTQRGTQES
jgi:transposase-like protein